MEFTIPTPRKFNFWSTVYSHGWCALPPFRVDKESRHFRLVVPYADGGCGEVTLREEEGALIVSLGSKHVRQEHVAEIANSVSSILRFEESLDPFYAEAKKIPRYRWVAKRGAGRMLRCPTVFEDIVKMICTTNCSWALTETMVNALVTKLGTRIRGEMYSFPTPSAIAVRSESFLRKEIRCGYRAPYLLELSRRIVNGSLDVERWRHSEESTEILFEQLRSVKGVGEYAAGNILKLLGRYDYLGLDSWSRGKFYERYKNGRKVKDATIEKHYAPLGKWKGLFLWMDVTKDWYMNDFPF